MPLKKAKPEETKPEMPQEEVPEGVTVVSSMSEAQREIIEDEMSDEPKVVKIQKRDQELPTTVKKVVNKKGAYKFVRSVKFQGRYYQIGDEVEASGDDLKMLIQNGLIQ